MANPVKPLGSHGLQVARLGFGCMSLSGNLYGGGKAPSEHESVEVLNRAYDLGVRLYNTSDLYGPYTNEELVGKALHGKEGVVIATKFGPMFVPGKGIVYDGSPENVRKCCEGALKRLGVSSIDLFTLRGPVALAGPDATYPFQDTMHAIKALVDEGKVKGVGLSEIGPEHIRAAHSIVPITAVEIEWSLFTRDVEQDIVPLCRELGIGFLAYSPLGRGLLTGAITNLDSIPTGDVRSQQPRFVELDKNLVLVERVKALAAKHACTAGQLALAWLLAKGDDIFPIPGTKRVSYLEENMGALKVHLSSEDIAELEAAVPDHEVAGARYADLKHATYHADKH